MSKKVLKLVNNERIFAEVTSAKACTVGAADTCYTADHAGCTTYALDTCKKDYAACYDGAHDVCEYIDNNAPCNGAGQMDYT